MARSNYEIIFDENILAYMHFEPTFFMVSLLLRRVREFTEKERTQ